MSDDKKLCLLQQVKSGAHGTYFPKFDENGRVTQRGSVSTYDDLEDLYHRLYEGGLVVDAREMPHRAAVVSSMGAPLFRPEQGCEVEEAPTPSDALVHGLEGVFQAVARAHKNGNKAVNLSTAGPGPYMIYWGKVGARLGQRVGDEIHWQDGEKEPIQFPEDDSDG